MNILQIHGRSAKFGGSEVHTEVLVNYLKTNDHKVTLVIPKGSEYLRENFESDSNVNLVYLETESVKSIISNVYKLKKLVIKNNIDVVHSHHRNADILSCLLKAICPQVKVVVTLHGPIANETRAFRKLTSYMHVKLMNTLADGVTYITDFVKKSYYSEGLKPKDDTIIYNASSKPIIQSDELADKLVRRNKFSVLMLCNVSGYKRVNLFLDVAEKFKHDNSVEFWVVGDGTDREALERRANEEGLNVKFWGWTRDVGAYVSSAQMVASTALNEGFGRTLTEALSYSKPIISFKSGGPTEIINHGYNGFLVPLG